MIYNSKEKPESINGIKVTNQIKYLGVTVTDKKNCFKLHREKSIEKARRLANSTYSITSRSCNKVLIGKTYWKEICLPAILYASGIMGYTKAEIANLQRIENSVYRHILGAPAYAQTPSLRGEIGSSTMEIRIRTNQTNFVKSVEENQHNDLLKMVVERKRFMKKDYWLTSVGGFMEKVNISYGELKILSKTDIKKK